MEQSGVKERHQQSTGGERRQKPQHRILPTAERERGREGERERA